MLRMLKDNMPFNPAAKAAWTGGPTGFRAGHDTSLPEAKSLRRDDGSDQAIIRVVDASHDAITLSVDWPTCSSLEPHQATATAPIPYRSRFPASGWRKKGLT